MLEAAHYRPTYRSVFRTRSSRRVAVAVAGVIGGVWLAGLVVASGFMSRAMLEGTCLFVGGAGLVLYAVTDRLTRQLTRAHRLLTTVVASIGDGVLILGGDRRILYANDAAVRMLECDSAANLIGIGAAEFSRRYGVSYLNGALVRPDAFASQRVFSEPSPIRYRARIYPSPEHELVVLCSAAAIRDRDEPHPTMAVSVLHDITDAEHLDRERDQLFSAAAHTLKTPVAIIKANVQHVAQRNGGDPSLAMIRRQCDRIDLLVQNLLIVARARSGTLELHVRVLELAPLVHQVVASLADFPLHAEVHVSPLVRADDERLALAITNLVHNAYRDAPRDTPLVLRVAKSAWTVEVAVHGHVLAADERMFSASSEYDDTRLSECAIRTIAEAHGGSVGRDEAEGERTTWIRLPLLGEDDRE